MLGAWLQARGHRVQARAMTTTGLLLDRPAAGAALRGADAELAVRVARLAELAGIELAMLSLTDPAPPVAVLLDALPGGHVQITVDPGRAAAAEAALPATVTIPGEEARLLDALVVAALPFRARTVGVLAAHGGAGASSLAAALARAATVVGIATALVDLDPGGGGLDVLLGIEFDPGRRWADVRAERGAFLAERLALTLPAWHLVRVLSGDRRGGADVSDLAVRSAVRALGQGHDLIVLDLPRQVLAPGQAREVWLDRCDDLVLLSRGGVRAGAATMAAAELAGAGPEVHLVVRSAQRHARDVAELAGLPLAGVMGTERSLNADVDHGLRPGDRRRGPLMTCARALVADLELDR